MTSPSASRRYHHQNRQRPCNRCREKKLKCQRDGRSPCERCQQSNVPCSLLGTPRRATVEAAPAHSDGLGEAHRSMMVTDQEVTPLASRHGQGLISSASAVPDIPVPILGELRGDGSTQSPSHTFGTPGFVPFSSRGPSTQISQSLDQIDGHYSQLFGSSSESDPWLLRHCKFDELGLRRFLKVHFRTAGGLPTREKIPVHFMISENDVCEGARAETIIAGEKNFRAELALLVPPECGPRIVQL